MFKKYLYCQYMGICCNNGYSIIYHVLRFHFLMCCENFAFVFAANNATVTIRYVYTENSHAPHSYGMCSFFLRSYLHVLVVSTCFAQFFTVNCHFCEQNYFVKIYIYFYISISYKVYMQIPFHNSCMLVINIKKIILQKFVKFLV